jgi:NADPH:quinone reductase-like Zn-dependent oxidoreductase
MPSTQLRGVIQLSICQHTLHSKVLQVPTGAGSDGARIRKQQQSRQRVGWWRLLFVLCTPGGSYAEYAIAWSHTTFHLPTHTSFEGASNTMNGVGSVAGAHGGGKRWCAYKETAAVKAASGMVAARNQVGMQQQYPPYHRHCRKRIAVCWGLARFKQRRCL